MAESAVSFAVKGISDLLLKEAQFLIGVRGLVEELQIELGRMQFFLKDADKRQDEEEAVRGWVSEIRELAYQSAALLETFALKFASRKEKGFRGECKRYASIFINGANVHTLGMEIKGIKAKIVNLTTNLETYGIKHRDDLEGSINPKVLQRRQLRKSYSYLEENTVGLVDDTQVVLHQLVGGSEKPQVVSICGMGGLGKTTLATKLYNHNTVRRHFDAFAWACVSQEFQVRAVLEEILAELSSSSDMPKEKCVDMNNGEIAKKLYQIQKEKRCLVVLDDVWKVEDWDTLKHAFPMGNIVGTIVITTRNKALAIHVDPKVFIHEPHTLSEDEGWELLKQKLVSTRDHQDLSNKEKLGREMVKRCAGLPLAIKVLGGLLATKHSLSEWNLVHKNVNMYLKRGQEHSDINGVLALSYYELPYNIKSCFLHLSHFPEDYSIPCKKLYRMWIAEGIVTFMPYEVIGEETLEDRAEIYLQELVDRCMVQVSETGSTKPVKSCRLHDLMRELCMLKANEENFFDVVYSHKKNETTSDTRLAHRLAVYVNNGEAVDINTYTNPFYLRSLLIVNEVRVYTFEGFSAFKLLKTLSLRRCLIPPKLTKEIGQLVYLKYLAFEQCEIESLPLTIGNLSYLQTLVIENRFGQKTIVPNVLYMLEKMRHLRLSGLAKSEDGTLIQLGSLKDVQTLQIDDIKLFDIQEIKNIANLRKISIRLPFGYKISQLQGVVLNHLTSLYVMFSDVENESALEMLFSSCHRLEKLMLEGNIEKLPIYQHFPLCLTKLSLLMSNLREDPMPILEKLSELTILKLDCAFDGNKMVCSSEGFPRLKTLFLHHLYKLTEWQVDKDAMPCLTNLHILYCARLKMVPVGVEFITTLHHLEVKGMPKEFTRRIKSVEGIEGEDFHKVRHVPSIAIF